MQSFRFQHRGGGAVSQLKGAHPHISAGRAVEGAKPPMARSPALAPRPQMPMCLTSLHGRRRRGSRSRSTRRVEVVARRPGRADVHYASLVNVSTALEPSRKPRGEHSPQSGSLWDKASAGTESR